jgi:hypothetical protein
MLPNCAFADCGDPACGVCSVSRRFPPIVPCVTQLEDGRCRLVRGHDGACKSPSGSTQKAAKATRDGDPKLAAERKRRHPMFMKRHRDGPHRSTA